MHSMHRQIKLPTCVLSVSAPRAIYLVFIFVRSLIHLICFYVMNRRWWWTNPPISTNETYTTNSHSIEVVL